MDLGNEFAIESVLVLNRWCVSPADPNGCLCRLSKATLFLMDSPGEVVAAQSVGDSCGKQELILDDFVEPTPSPTVSPSYSPTLSLSPTRSMVKDFSLVGDGQCVDESYSLYPSMSSSVFPARYTDIYCLDWCSQNPSNLVGVEVNYEEYSAYCSCLFSGGLPFGLKYSDYSPPAAKDAGFLWGVGPILTSRGYNNGILCYRYDVSSLLNYEHGYMYFIFHAKNHYVFISIHLELC